MAAEETDKQTGVSGQGAPGIPEIEEEVIRFWEDNRIFEKSLEKTKDGKPFTFYDGPPFATGLPHYGHMLASTIKDVIPRYQTMRGRFVRRRWGWDCHGLPIEALVEKKLGISGKKQIEEIGIQTFNETCRSMVLEYVGEWRKMVRRLGRWVDFDHSYKTMDRDYMESVWWAFKQVYDKGLAYEGRKVLLYCPRCETPISNFEVAMDNSYKDVTEESVYVRFKIKGEDAHFLAWTTTPWTLPGNVALAVGPDIDYSLIQAADGKYVLASALVGKLFAGQSVEVVKEVKGSELVGKSYEPLFAVAEVAASDKAFKVYAADFVTTEDGTGIVHTAVVYGEDDYQLGVREGLPVVPLLDEKGHFNDKAPELVRGQYFKKAEKAVKDDLEARGLLWKRENYTHPYPHCWRCSTALYYNAIPAWFVNVQKIKQDLLKTNDEQINWFPEHLKRGRYQKSVEAAPDWNISRNRYWGNPIPAWKCADCGKNTVVGSLQELRERAVPAKNRYLFLRHGQSENNAQGISSTNFETQGKYHLTPLGKEQVSEAVGRLKGMGIDLVYASDFERTRETVEVVSRELGVTEVRKDARLREINVGPFDEKPYEDYHAYFASRAERYTKRPPQGETMADVMARGWDFLKEMERTHEGKTILIVSHGDPIWSMIGVMSGWSYEQMEEESTKFPKSDPVPNASVTETQLFVLPRNPQGLVDMHRPYIDEVVLRCDHCGGNAQRTPEIFDSWVEAGSMPFSEYHYPFENKEVFESRFPGQFVAEYIAQTRAWFYVMHVISQIIFGRAPFENVVTTGTILAEDGSKMSKSKNNYPDPWEVIHKYGIDTVRFYLMNSVVMQADNLNFSLKDLENVHRKVVLILWNVYQYFLTYAPQAGVPEAAAAGAEFAASPHVLDRWIAARVKLLVAEVTTHLDGYDTVRATREIAAFVDDLSTWYLRRSRGRDDASFYPTFRQVLVTTAQVIAPFMPHVADAVYRGVRTEANPESVHLAAWPSKEELSEEERDLLDGMKVVREAASWGLMFRKAANIPVRQPLARMALLTEGKELSRELLDILLSELNVKAIDPAIAASAEPGMQKVDGQPPVKALYIDTNLTPELKLEGLTRKLERAIQEKRKEMGLKVGEMARLTYFAADADTEAAFKNIDTKKTYIADVAKGDGPSGSFELSRS